MKPAPWVAAAGAAEVAGVGGCGETVGKPRNRRHNPPIGTAHVHTVNDDHSRVACADIHDNETRSPPLA